MQPHWPVFRSALQQLFLTLPESQFISAIYSTENGIEYQHRPVNDGYWEHNIFKPTFVFDTPLNIKKAFEKIQEKSEDFVSPKIVLLTASDFSQSEELNQALDFIKNNLLSVDILTTRNAQNSDLMDLSIFGQVFASK